MPLLICGYRRHGKDLFYQRSKNGLLQGVMSNYHLYMQQGRNMMFKFIGIIESPGSRRLSLAWPIKEELGKVLGLSASTVDIIKDNQVKNPDLYNFQYVRPSNPMVYRDLLRDISSKGKAADPDYWAKQLVVKCSWDSIITDFRYPNEYTTISNKWLNDTVTLRVYYSRGTIPDYQDISEHSLDEFMTDFIASDVPLKIPGYQLVEKS